MHVIITGAAGQDSWYLQFLLKSLGLEFSLVGVAPPHESCSIGNFEHVCNLIRTTKPSHIFHFAAKSSARHEHLFSNHTALVTGTMNLLEACRLHAPETRIFLCGSGLQFENTGISISEDAPFAVRSAYACARVQSVYLGRYYREHFQLNVFVGYLYGHESPRRPESFVSKKLTSAALSAQRDRNQRCEVGNLSVMREFGYAGDIVCGMWLLANQTISSDTIWEANVCTGVAISLADWAETAFALVGLKASDFVYESPHFKTDYAVLVGQPSKILSLGWVAKVDRVALCRMMLGLDSEHTTLRNLTSKLQSTVGGSK